MDLARQHALAEAGVALEVADERARLAHVFLGARAERVAQGVLDACRPTVELIVIRGAFVAERQGQPLTDDLTMIVRVATRRGHVGDTVLHTDRPTQETWQVWEDKTEQASCQIYFCSSTF